MSHYDFGNYNRDNDYSLYQIGRSKKAAEDAQTLKTKDQEQAKRQVYEQKRADANSLEALGNYGLAFTGLSDKKTDVSALGLGLHDQIAVGKYVTPDQQDRITEDMMKYFG